MYRLLGLSLVLFFLPPGAGGLSVGRGITDITGLASEGALVSDVIVGSRRQIFKIYLISKTMKKRKYSIYALTNQSIIN